MTFHHQRRLDRALHHLESLESVRDAWLRKNPYRTWTEPDVDPRKKLLWVEALDQPPAELSLIVGDCLHNLRSSLDNLMLELAMVYKRGRVSKSIEGDSQFPILTTDIAKDPEVFQKFKRMTRGIDPLAKTVIEGLQPYKRGERFATNDPLWKLNELYNTDKHRLPHVVLLGTAYLSFWVPAGPGADEVETSFNPIEDRAPIARYRAVDDTGAEVDMNLNPTFDVAFGQRAPKQVQAISVSRVLSGIHAHIRSDVLPPLAPYLSRH